MSYNTYLLDDKGNPVNDKISGEMYVSVSQILSVENPGDFLSRWLLMTFGGQPNPIQAHKDYMNQVSDLGTRIHHFVECELTNQPYPGIVKEDMMPGIESFFRFKKEHDIEVMDVERVLHSRKYRCAGTLDLRAKIDGKPYLIDLKTGSVQGKAFIQLMAYNIMMQEMGILEEPHELLVLGGASSKEKIADGGDFVMHDRESFFKGQITKEDLFVWFQCLRQIWYLKNVKSTKFKPIIKQMQAMVDPLIEDFKNQFQVSGIDQESKPKTTKKKKKGA